jgi:hypothetical protein
MQGVLTVPKEEIGQLHFIKKDILSDTISRKNRLAALLKAQTLGNLYHQKVTIIYVLNDGNLQQVETTVWAVGGDYIALKGGMNLPIHAILEVEF